MNFWADFAPTSNEEWKKAVEASLKGKSYDSLLWQLGNGLAVEPAYHHAPALSVPSQRADNYWFVVEKIVVGDDLEAARLQALNALNGGASALHWVINRPIKQWEEIAQLCDNVFLNMIQSHWSGTATQAMSFLQFLYLVAGDVAGSVHIPTSDEDSYLWAIESMPQMRIWDFSNDTSLAPDQQLANILTQCDALLWDWMQRRVEPEDIAARIRIVWTLSDSFLLETAKLRAFRRLWAAWLSAYSEAAAAVAPHLYCITTLSQKDKHSNMINATAQAMAAVLGHTDSLYVQPVEESNFGHRIARNVSNLLNLESHLTKVIDPAAGSYYIENLTDMLVQSAWKLFLAKHA